MSPPVDAIEPQHGIGGSTRGRFVIQEHHARTHHFDYRLERDGVFKSWAVPKNLPVDPGVRRLAVEVEDHPLEYGEFEGEIPAGEYGAGQVKIWDRGMYEAYEWGPNRISFTLAGDRLSGRFELVRFAKRGDRAWLIFQRST
ncbi:MAG: DNA polymerase ligase N-terminal domain-containing protein [Limisphaerales bacterium]